MTESPEHTIAILGPGLLGGSVALAVRKHSPETKVRIWGRSAEKIEKINAMQIADFASTDAGEVVDGATLVVLATPVEAMATLAGSVLGRIRRDAIVTDVGSVKKAVVESLEPMLRNAGIRFVGSHPMAGSEKTGIKAAKAALFEGAICLLTPTAGTDGEALSRTTRFWQQLGATTLELSLEEHDRQVARISHMPHAVAFALTIAALRDSPEAARIVGKGFRDSTRIAASDPGLWTGILLENQGEVVKALEDAQASVKAVLDLVKAGDKETLHRFIEQAQQLRSLVKPAPKKHGNDQSPQAQTHPR